MSLTYFHLPARLLTGLDSLGKLPELLRPFGDRVLILCESTVFSLPLFQNIQSSLERSRYNLVIYTDIEHIRGTEAVDALLQKIRVSRPHAMVAIGGMRTLSLVRLLASTAPSKTTVERYLSGTPVHEAPIPVINIPTSARDPFCGSDFIFANEMFMSKATSIHQARNPIVASIFDPKLHNMLPPKQAAIFLMDQLLGLTDILASTHNNIVSDTNAQSAIGTAAHALRSLTSGKLELKTSIEACNAGVLASLAIASSNPGIGYAISASIHARFGTPKSLVSVILLPHILESYVSYKGSQFISLAQALGSETDPNDPDKVPLLCAQAVRRLIAKFALPARLQDLKITQTMIPEIATLVIETSLAKSCPWPVSLNTVADFLRKAL